MPGLSCRPRFRRLSFGTEVQPTTVEFGLISVPRFVVFSEEPHSEDECSNRRLSWFYLLFSPHKTRVLSFAPCCPADLPAKSCGPTVHSCVSIITGTYPFDSMVTHESLSGSPFLMAQASRLHYHHRPPVTCPPRFLLQFSPFSFVLCVGPTVTVLKCCYDRSPNIGGSPLSADNTLGLLLFSVGCLP